MKSVKLHINGKTKKRTLLDIIEIQAQTIERLTIENKALQHAHSCLVEHVQNAVDDLAEFEKQQAQIVIYDPLSQFERDMQSDYGFLSQVQVSCGIHHGATLAEYEGKLLHDLYDEHELSRFATRKPIKFVTAMRKNRKHNQLLKNIH